MKYHTTLLLLICLICNSCSERQAVEKVYRPVRYEQVFSTGGSKIRTFAGVARSGSESTLSPKVSGTIEKLAVQLGDKVRIGQLLIKIDDTDLELQVKEAEAARDQARAREIQAESEYERVRTLYENRSASRSQLESARAAFEAAHEQDNILKKRRNLARRQMEYCTITAPLDGSISQVMVEENENVSMGQPLLVITSGSNIEVRIGIPEILITQIREGNPVEVTFDAIKGRFYRATVTEVGVAATGFATTYPVTVRLADSDNLIRPGMAAEVTFTFKSEDQKQRFLVPAVAVGEDRLGKYVYTVQPADSAFGTIQRKNVTIGELEVDGLEIYEGLEDGDYLVTAGISKIHEGQKVKIRPAGE